MSSSSNSANASAMDSERLKLNDRQRYVLGLEALFRLQSANVLIIGLNGVGVEIGTVVFCLCFQTI